MTQLLVFNGGLRQGGGLDLSFARNIATTDDLGVSVQANTPRYGRTRALVNREIATTLKTMTGSGTLVVLAGGVTEDGSTPLVFGRLTGAASGYRVFSGNNLDQANIVDGTLDLLGDSIQIGGNTAQHFADGAQIIHGLVVAAVNVTYTGSPPNVVTLCYSTDAGQTWSRAPVASANQWATDSNYPDPTPGVTSTATSLRAWAFNWFPITGGNNPTAVWLTLTDYIGGTDGKDGGTVWIARATRPDSTSSNWTVGPLRQIYRDTVTGSGDSGRHMHSCGMMRDPSTGIWYAIVFMGDTSYNHVAKVQIGSSDGSDYETATLTTVDDWSGTPTATYTEPLSPQPTACALTPSGDLIAGADLESHAVLAIRASSLTAAKASWYYPGPQGHGSAKSTSRSTINLNLVHAKDNYGDLFVTTHKVAETVTADTNEESLIASVDGQHWFNLANDLNVRFVAGPYILGTVNGTDIVGVSRVRPPDVLTVRPLCVAPGVTNKIPAWWSTGTNQQLPSGSLNNQASFGHIVWEVADTGNGLVWPSGFTRAGQAMPTPPGYDGSQLVLAVKTPNTATNEQCWRNLMTNADVGVEKCVSMWLHVPQDCQGIGVKVASNAPAEALRLVRYANSDGWDRFVHWNVSASSLPNMVRLFVDTYPDIQVGEFAVMFESAVLGRTTPYPTTYGTINPPSEHADVTGLNITSGNDYAVTVHALLPEYFGSDTALGPLFCLYQDASNYIEVNIVDSPSGGAADGFPYDLQCRVVVGGTATTGYINGAASHLPGAAMRITVSRVGSDTVLRYQAHQLATQTVTVAGAVVPAPSTLMLARSADDAVVNHLEFAGVRVAKAASDSEALIPLLRLPHRLRPWRHTPGIGAGTGVN